MMNNKCSSKRHDKITNDEHDDIKDVSPDIRLSALIGPTKPVYPNPADKGVPLIFNTYATIPQIMPFTVRGIAIMRCFK